MQIQLITPWFGEEWTLGSMVLAGIGCTIAGATTPMSPSTGALSVCYHPLAALSTLAH